MQILMQEKSLIKKNILQYLELKGISKYKFYQETGIARGVLDQNNGLTEENIFKVLAWARDISPNWLLSSDKSLYSDDDKQPATVSDNIILYNKGKAKEKTIGQQVPLYKFNAGIVDFSDIKNLIYDTFIQIPNLPKCDGATYIIGDDMYPLLKNGDIVVYKIINSLENLFWGEIYLLSIINHDDAFITIKYLQKSDRDGFIRLVSHNQHYQDKEIPLDALKHAALIKASIHYNNMY